MEKKVAEYEALIQEVLYPQYTKMNNRYTCTLHEISEYSKISTYLLSSSEPLSKSSSLLLDGHFVNLGCNYHAQTEV